MKKLSIISIPMILVSVCTLNAGGTIKEFVAQQHPFDDMDIALFCNAATKQIESPYSTALVLLFSESEKVLVEKEAYEKLREHALERSSAAETTALNTYKECHDSDGGKRLYFSRVCAAAKMSNDHFQSL